MRFINRLIMKFTDLFRDQNSIDEKNVVGFLSFTVMVIFAIVEIVMGILGEDFHISDMIYNSFFWLTIGSFGISQAGKSIPDLIKKRKTENSNEIERPTPRGGQPRF